MAGRGNGEDEGEEEDVPWQMRERCGAGEVKYKVGSGRISITKYRQTNK